MLIKILKAGVFAGLIAGILTSILQILTVVPIVTVAELFETGTVVYFDGNSPFVKLSSLVGESRDLKTNIFTIISTTVTAIGFALLLTSIIAVREDSLTPKQGALWGIFAFIAIGLAPAIGLPPELPGFGASQVFVRQIWWIATAILTSIGLWQIVFKVGILRTLIGVVIIALPHLIGVPHADAYMGTTPPEMGAHFATMALANTLVMWVLIGTFIAKFYKD